MRLARRHRDAPAGEVAEDAPSPSTPPRGAPVSAYCAVLDGRTLWLAVEARPGRLALRAADGTVLTLPSDLAEDASDFLAVRSDLAALLPVDEAEYEVVLLPERGAPVAVWSPPLAPLDPLRVPPGPEGRQLAVRRGDDGTLRILQRRAEPGVGLTRVDLSEDAIVLHLPHASGEVLLLADVDDRPVLRLPLEDGVATLRLSDLPPPADVQTRVVVGAEDGWLPVRRPRNDLANAGHAALLPVLADPEDGHALVRLRWRPGGVLAARLHPEWGQP